MIKLYCCSLFPPSLIPEHVNNCILSIFFFCCYFFLILVYLGTHCNTGQYWPVATDYWQSWQKWRVTTITQRYSHIGSNERSGLSKENSFYSYFVLSIHLPERNPHQKVLFPVYVKSGVFLLTATHRWVVCDGSTKSTSFPFQGCRRHAASIDFSRIPECSACHKQCRKQWQIVLMHMSYLIAPELAQQVFITLGP